MTIYETNYEALKERPLLFDKLFELEKNSLLNNKLTHIEEQNTREDMNALIVTEQNTTYRLNSSYYPTKEAKIWASQYEMKDLQVYVIMYGMGNGVFPRAIANILRPNDNMILYEPSVDLFFYILEHYDISDLLMNSKITLCVEEMNDYEYHSVLRDKIDWLNVHYQVFCCHPYYDTIFPQSYKKFLLELKDNNIKALVNRNTLALFGQMSVVNMIHNLKFIKKSNVDLDFFEEFSELEVPAIIVSAGPSLSKNIEYLKNAKGKAVIFVVDRALDYVLDHGIMPDFIVTLDSSKPIEFFSKYSDLKIPLLCTVDASIPVMEAHKGRKIFFAIKGYVSYIYYELQKKVSSLNSGGCVATGAFSVCAGLGFKTIILMGQDLAFSKDHSTHAEGIAGDREDQKRVHKIVEGIDGSPVETRHDWYAYLTWFQDAIKDFPEITVVDATEGGAKIIGTKIMSLKQAIEEYCIIDIDCNSIMSNKKPTLDDNDLVKLRKIIHEAISNLKEISWGGSKAKQYCIKLSEAAKKSTIGDSKSQELVNKISVINNTILKYPAYKFVDNDISIVSIQNLSDIYRFTGIEQQDQIITYLKAEKIYEAISESADKIRPQLEEILTVLDGSE